MPNEITVPPGATRIERITLSVAQQAGLHGLRCEAVDLPGTPDVACDASKVALFAHGCFWHAHGCGLSRLPATNQEFWRTKFARNRARDIRVSGALRANGWRVIWLWECACHRQTASTLARTVSAALAKGLDFVEVSGAPSRTA